MGKIFKKVMDWLRSKICPCQCQKPSEVSIIPPAISNFDYAFEWVFKDEGGFSNHPSDRGGPTKYGITIQTLSAYRKRTVTIDDVRSLSKEEARAIYQAWYWMDVGLEKIKSRAIATCIFDSGVLIGQRTAVTFTQISANSCGAKLVVDGYCGPLTQGALEAVDTYEFLNAYRDLLKTRFDWIVAKDSSQIAFYSGWMNRANRLLTLAN